jgi:hypothetical protein
MAPCHIWQSLSRLSFCENAILLDLKSRSQGKPIKTCAYEVDYKLASDSDSLYSKYPSQNPQIAFFKYKVIDLEGPAIRLVRLVKMFHQTQEFISRHRYFSSLLHFESEKLPLSNSNVNHFIRCCDAGDVGSMAANDL